MKMPAMKSVIGIQSRTNRETDMTIDFQDESGVSLPIDPVSIASEVIPAVLDYLKCPYEVSVGLLITNDEAIRKLNLEYRQIDAATDVLSFPMENFPTPFDPLWLEGPEAADCFDPDSGELLLGDIVISADHVLAQSEEFGHSVKREFAFLTVHSMLHLFGYDHMTEDDARQMEQIQREILDILEIYR